MRCLTKKFRAGMTLVELIIGMLIFSIMALSLSIIMISTLRVYNRANELAEINSLLDNLSSEMLNDISMASGIVISGSQIAVNKSVVNSIETDGDEVFVRKSFYSVNYFIADSGSYNGILCRDAGLPVFERGYYKGKTLAIEFFRDDGVTPISGSFSAGDLPYGLIITLTLFDSGGNIMASRNYAAKPLGIT